MSQCFQNLRKNILYMFTTYPQSTTTHVLLSKSRSLAFIQIPSTNLDMSFAWSAQKLRHTQQTPSASSKRPWTSRNLDLFLDYVAYLHDLYVALPGSGRLPEQLKKAIAQSFFHWMETNKPHYRDTKLRWYGRQFWTYPKLSGISLSTLMLATYRQAVYSFRINRKTLLHT